MEWSKSRFSSYFFLSDPGSNHAFIIRISKESKWIRIHIPGSIIFRSRLQYRARNTQLGRTYVCTLYNDTVAKYDTVLSIYFCAVVFQSTIKSLERKNEERKKVMPAKIKTNYDEIWAVLDIFICYLVSMIQEVCECTLYLARFLRRCRKLLKSINTKKHVF